MHRRPARSVFPFSPSISFFACVPLFSPDCLKTDRVTVQSFVSLISSLRLLLSPFLRSSPNGLRVTAASSLPATTSRLDPPLELLFAHSSIFRCDVTFPGPISSFFRTRRQASPASLLSTGFSFTSLLSKSHSGGSPVEPKRMKTTDGLPVTVSQTHVLIGFFTRTDLTDGTEYSAGRRTRTCFSAVYMF